MKRSTQNPGLPFRRSSGFSLVEILVSVIIIAILGSLIMVGYGPARDNAERVACISHMRAIHGALAEYIQDKGMWPQEPETGSDQMLNEDWWITTLAPYDITPAIWICPAIKRLTSKCDPAEVPRLSYLPGMFDATPTAPFKFATQPWLLERASAHRRGPNVCYPDGSIHTMDELLGKQ